MGARVTEAFDIIVVGGGMAGMSIGAELAADADVLVLEAEDAPGYHATGRSVSFWSETYGGPAVQPLTTASGPLMIRPDPDFSDVAFLSPRGCLHIGPAEAEADADAFVALFTGQGVDLRRVGRDEMEAMAPGLAPHWTVGVTEPDCKDIDASGLLAAYRRQLLRRGGTLRCGASFRGARREGEGWRVETDAGTVTAAVLINAAGAWADHVARLSDVAPIGITPLRRTVAQVRVDPAAPADLPLVKDLAETFYFKSVPGGRLWLTPHDEEPQPPGDAAPEDLAIAIAIDRFERAVDWRVLAVERSWAGLRSFAPDLAPVYGFDPMVPGFFWFAGQGGFGIQTAPAAALLGAALVAGRAPDPRVAHIDMRRYAPDRFNARLA